MAITYKGQKLKAGTKFKYSRPAKKMIKNYPFKSGMTPKSSQSIPTPNPDPQPPNAQPTIQSLASNLQNTASSQAPGQTQQTPVQNQAFSSYTPASGKPDPRDSQYWQDVTRMWFDRTQKEQQANTDETYAQTAYEQALQARTMQHPRDILASNIGANQMGNLTSSVQQEDLGQLEQNYYLANTDSERQFQQEEASRKIARDAIAQGYTIDEAAALAEAVNRQTQSELDQPPPIDPNADTYGDTYDSGQSADLKQLINQMLGGKAGGKKKPGNKSPKKSPKKPSSRPRNTRPSFGFSSNLANRPNNKPKKKK